MDAASVDDIKQTIDRAARVIGALHAVIAAYEKAMDDPQTKIPTYLHAAIENARKQ